MALWAVATVQGWVPLSVLAEHMRSKPSLEEIRSVVADNDKVSPFRSTACPAAQSL